MSFVTRLQIHLRFVLYLLWDFRWPLAVFAALVLLGGLGLQAFYEGKKLTYPQACYAVFLIIFLQPNIEISEKWYLQPFFFLLPIVGLGTVADSLLRLAYIVFAQKRNSPEWQRMVASSYRNHIVVVGVGKVGFHIIKGLVALSEPVVAVEIQAQGPFLEEAGDLGVPIIIGNGRNRKTLEEAGAGRARVIVLATDDDLANLDAALTARDINPAVRVVLRLFDHTLATKFASAFQMPAISVSEVSAPAFIAAATKRKVYQSFELGGCHLHMTDVSICPTGSLVGRTVGEIQAKQSVNIVMHRGACGVKVNPAHDTVLGPDDTVLVFAEMEHLIALERANQPAQARQSATAQPSA